MITWFLYSVVIGLLLILTGASVERFARAIRGNVRFVWASVMVATIGVALLPIVLPFTESTRLPSDSSRPDVALALAWVIASVLAVGVLLMSAWHITRMRASWHESAIAGVPVLVSHDVGPAVVGLVHHGIVVPSWVEGLGVEAQRMVMSHEREHVRAGDPLLLWFGTSLVALMPWNVALWYAYRRMRHGIEIDCDARVLRGRADAGAYCALLLDVGERTLAGVAPIAALAEPATLLERRIDAMTSGARGTLTSTLACLAAVASLATIAFIVPRNQVQPDRVLAAIWNAPGLLSRDATRANTVKYPRAFELLASDAWESALSPSLNDAVKRAFPELNGRRDNSHRLLTLTYDRNGQLRGHAARRSAPWQSYRAPDFSNVQIKVFAIRPLDSINATVAIVVEKWSVDGEPRVSAYGGRYGPAESSHVPPQLQFARRVDSLARREFPGAYEPQAEPLAILAMFDADGRVVRTIAKRMRRDDLFEPLTTRTGRSSRMVRSASSLLSRVFSLDVAAFASYGAQTLHDTPNAVLLFTQETTPGPSRVQ